MEITVHRGTHQIGGCVTEIASGGDKVFIDFGADLPGAATSAPPGEIAGLTAPLPDGAASALFFTHYHGDHMGRLGEVLPGIPVYMGKTAKALAQNYARHIHSELSEPLDAVHPFVPLQRIRVGRITVTPLMVDHSAFDAYLFVVEAEGKRILHTGDFRLHGFRGGKTLPMLRSYARNIDCVICETTNLSREDVPMMTERELQEKAREILRENKYVFVLCSSTNIDRIGAFYHATSHERLFLCDAYQMSQLELVQEHHMQFSSLYDFSHVLSYGKNLDALMEQKGFCMIVRQGKLFSEVMERYRGKSRVVYSMWGGYLHGETKNAQLEAFLEGYDYTVLHTSGHASVQDLLRLYETVQPKVGLLPIHGEAPEQMAALLPEGKLLLRGDGEVFSL